MAYGRMRRPTLGNPPTCPFPGDPMTRPRRLGVAALAGLIVAGCSIDAFTYISDRYGRVGPGSINLNCRDTYEVYDRPDAMTLLVVTNSVNEILVNCLDGGGPDLATRMRQVARIFFDEKTNRPQCRITGETELTIRHREFSYTCAASPVTSTKPRRS